MQYIGRATEMWQWSHASLFGENNNNKCPYSHEPKYLNKSRNVHYKSVTPRLNEQLHAVHHLF